MLDLGYLSDALVIIGHLCYFICPIHINQNWLMILVPLTSIGSGLDMIVLISGSYYINLIICILLLNLLHDDL